MAEGDKQKTGASRPVARIRKGSSYSSYSHSNSTLHPREVTLIRELWFWGWSDYQIWKEYRIPFPVIQKAKDEIERQAIEEFGNKEQHAVELAKFKERLRFIIDTNDAIARDKNLSLTDRLKSEAIMLDALAMLQDAIEASMSSSDPYSALGKILEQSNRRRRLSLKGDSIR